MKLIHNLTGETLELPAPDFLGASVVLFNGRVVERILYSDVSNSVTLANGRRFPAGPVFASYLISQLESGAYRTEASL